jgi:hypothetical protein
LQILDLHQSQQTESLSFDHKTKIRATVPKMNPTDSKDKDQGLDNESLQNM